jgi:NAD(P)-dependent dehydrogenase (short-subunit alcohol dehydrogenase family)
MREGAGGAKNLGGLIARDLAREGAKAIADNNHVHIR